MERSRLASTFLGAALVFACAACGDDGGGTGSTGGGTAGSTATSRGTAGSTSTTSSTSSTSSGSSTSGTTSGSSTSAATGASTGTGTADTGTTGASSSSDGGGSTATGSGTAGSGGALQECSGIGPMDPCTEPESCYASKCCLMTGFCIDKDAPTCGGFIGESCPAGLVCVTDACIADGLGVCVDKALAEEIVMAQPGCWMASGG